MNRQELSWALSAALPHAGKGKIGGIWLESRNGLLYVYATDSYTIGVASVADPHPSRISAKLTPKEAGELERWIRPQLVADRELGVGLAQRGNEMHIAYSAPDGETDSAVFDCEDGSHLDAIFTLINAAEAKPLEQRPIGINPAFIARFVKAGEAVRIEWKEWGSRMGALFVQAPNFVGLAANLEYSFTPAGGDLHNLLAS